MHRSHILEYFWTQSNVQKGSYCLSFWVTVLRMRKHTVGTKTSGISWMRFLHKLLEEDLGCVLGDCWKDLGTAQHFSTCPIWGLFALCRQSEWAASGSLTWRFARKSLQPYSVMPPNLKLRVTTRSAFNIFNTNWGHRRGLGFWSKESSRTHQGWDIGTESTESTGGLAPCCSLTCNRLYVGCREDPAMEVLQINLEDSQTVTVKGCRELAELWLLGFLVDRRSVWSW